MGRRYQLDAGAGVFAAAAGQQTVRRDGSARRHRPVVMAARTPPGRRHRRREPTAAGGRGGGATAADRDVPVDGAVGAVQQLQPGVARTCPGRRRRRRFGLAGPVDGSAGAAAQRAGGGLGSQLEELGVERLSGVGERRHFLADVRRDRRPLRVTALGRRGRALTRRRQTVVTDQITLATQRTDRHRLTPPDNNSTPLETRPDPTVLNNQFPSQEVQTVNML